MVSILLAAVLRLSRAAASIAKSPVDFGRDVAPILEQHCIRCHQPSNRKAGISLATFADLKSNEYVVAGDPDASYLVDVVTAAAGEKPQMPKEGAPLSAQEVSTLRDWIREGAHWPDGVVVKDRAKADQRLVVIAATGSASSRRRTAFRLSGVAIRSIDLFSRGLPRQGCGPIRRPIDGRSFGV